MSSAEYTDPTGILRHHHKHVIMASTAALVPWSKNPRKITPAAIEHHAALIEELGFTNPILARRDTCEVIAGHLRLAAAKRLGLKEVPTLFLDVSDEEARRIALSDNPKPNELHGQWDEDALAGLLEELDTDGIRLEGLGWTDDELADLLTEPEPADGGPGNPGPLAYVRFTFGDISGLVARSVYDRFRAAVEGAKAEDGSLMLDDVVGAAWPGR